MHLSPKGWNNVLIFGVLLLILIFKFSQKSTIPSSISTHPIISPDLTIVEIETPDYSISRVGRNWESHPNLSLSSEKLASIVDNWQTVRLDSLIEPHSSLSPFLIKVFVAEQADPIIIQLYQQPNNQYIVQIDGASLLILPLNKLPLYLGR